MNTGVLFTLTFTCIVLLSRGGVEGRLVYVGAESNNLYLCDFDEQFGNLKLISTTVAENPSFLALHPSREYLYAVNEVETFHNISNSGGISAYKIDRNGGLQFINSVPSLGMDPAHIEIDATGQWIGVANYGSGNYGVWKVNRDFSLASNTTSFFQDEGHGPMPQQDGPHAHEFVFSRSNSFVVVPDLGNDSWNQYSFDDRTGEMKPISAITAPAGSGPRHFAFHPFLPYAYGVSEIASTVTVFAAPEPLKSLSVVQRISTLPSSVSSAAAELQFSPDGQVLYVSNRLTNATGSIAIFSIDQSNGQLDTISYASTLGVQPRYFRLSEDGRFVLVANQFSNNIVVLTRDEKTGQIGRPVSTLENLNQPSHILFL